MKTRFLSFIRLLAPIFQRKLVILGTVMIVAGAALLVYLQTAAEPAVKLENSKKVETTQTADKQADASVEAPVAQPTTAPGQAPAASSPAKPVAPSPAPTPAPAIPVSPPSISVNPTAYNAPSINGGLFFTTINLRSSYLVYAHKVVGASVPDAFSATVTVTHTMGPDGRNEAGYSYFPQEMLYGASSGDEFDVLICENRGGSCGVRSNVLRVVLHNEPGFMGPGRFLYEFRR